MAMPCQHTSTGLSSKPACIALHRTSSLEHAGSGCKLQTNPEAKPPIPPHSHDISHAHYNCYVNRKPLIFSKKWDNAGFDISAVMLRAQAQSRTAVSLPAAPEVVSGEDAFCTTAFSLLCADEELSFSCPLMLISVLLPTPLKTKKEKIVFPCYKGVSLAGNRPAPESQNRNNQCSPTQHIHRINLLQSCFPAELSTLSLSPYTQGKNNSSDFSKHYLLYRA